MKNSLGELRKLVTPKDKKKLGVILSNNQDGGFIVEPITGGSEIVFGTADVGESILYEDSVIVSRLKREVPTVYYIK